MNVRLLKLKHVKRPTQKKNTTETFFRKMLNTTENKIEIAHWHTLGRYSNVPIPETGSLARDLS